MIDRVIFYVILIADVNNYNVVTGGMGGAVQKLNEEGIKAYRATPGTAVDIVSQFTKGGLEEITIQNACAQHGCH